MNGHTRRGVLTAVGGTLAVAVGTGGATGDEEGESDEEVEPGNDAARVVHLSPDAPALDIYVEGEPWFEGVEPFDVQDHFTPSKPGTYDVAAVPAGEDLEKAIYEKECVVEPGPCTLAAIGEVCNISDSPFDLVVIRDDHTETEQGHARLQASHAVPDAPMIDVTMENGTTVAEELEFGDSNRTEVPAEESILVVRASDGSGMEERFEVDPTPGHVYSVFSIGYVDPENAPEAAPDDMSLMLAVTEDAAPGEH